LFYTLFRASHPGMGERIDFCNRYRPWQTGGPLRYASLFQSEPEAGPPARSGQASAAAPASAPDRASAQ
jgi:hypothetical protein